MRVSSLAVFCLLFSSGVSNAQLPIAPNAVDAAGRRTGHWVTLFDSAGYEVKNPDSAKFYRLIRFDAGKPVGKVRDFYLNGVRQWDGFLTSLSPSIMEGETHTYFENGKLYQKAIYHNNLLEGPYQEYDIAGRLRIEGSYHRGLSSGHWKWYYENGNIQSEVDMREGRHVGLNTAYHEDGKIHLRGRLTNGEWDGVLDEFFPSGKLKSRSVMKLGKYNGLHLSYDESGALLDSGEYRLDVAVGPWKSWHAKGVLKCVGRYDMNGKRTGLWKDYGLSGKLTQEGQYTLGLQQGWWKYYYESGALQAEGDIKDGEWNGAYTRYHENGKIHRKGQNVRDTLDGHWVTYYPNGNIEEEGSYTIGAKKGLWKYYAEEGYLYSVHPMKDDRIEGRTYVYHPNGQIDTEGVCHAGLPDSVFTAYYPDGKLASRGLNKEGKKEGEWTWWFPNGQINTKANYKADALHGDWVQYFDNGVIKGQGQAIDGLRDGLARFYYQNGNRKKEGVLVSDLNEGRWIEYDSASGSRSSEGDYVKNKLHGVWHSYDAQGKITATNYYVHGFHETATSIRDSIYTLLSAARYDAVADCIAWLEQVVKRDKNKEDYGLIPYFRGYLAQARGDHENALTWFRDYVSTVRRSGGTRSSDYSVALSSMATALQGMNRREEALSNYQEALTIQEAIGQRDSENYVIILSNRASCFAGMNRGKEGLHDLLREVSYRENGGKTHDAAYYFLLDRLAAFYTENLLENEKGITVYKKLLAQLVSDSDTVNLLGLTARRNIGYAYRSLSKTDSCTAWLSAAVQFQDALGIPHPTSYNYDLLWLGVETRNRDQYDSAGKVIGKLLAWLEESGRKSTAEYATALTIKGTVLFRMDFSADAIGFYEQAKALFEKLGLYDSDDYAACLHGLGQALPDADISRVEEAIGMLRKSAAVKEKLFGKKSPALWGILIDIGVTRRQNAQFHEALDEMAIAERAILDNGGGKTRWYGSCENQIGLVYYATSRYKEAKSYYHKALTAYLANPAEDPAECANVLSNIGSVFQYENQYDSALRYYQRAIEYVRHHLGENHLEFQKQKRYLAIYYMGLSRYTDAESTLREILEGYQRLVGTENTIYANIVRDLGKLYEDMGAYPRALSRYRDYESLVVRLSGRLSRENIANLSRIAGVYASMKQEQKAEETHLLALSLGREYYGQKNLQYAFLLKNLALYYSNHYKTARAEQLMREATAIAEETFGRGSSDFGVFLVSLANLCSRLDKNQEAEKYFVELVAIASADKSSWAYLNALRDLSFFYQKLGRYEEAGKLFDDRAKGTLALSGKDVNYAMAQVNLAGAFRDAGQYDRAKSLLQEALPLLEEEFEPASEVILDARNSLGLIGVKQLKFDSAEMHFRYCVTTREGAGRAKTAAQALSLQNLGHAYMQLGRFQEAEQLMLRSRHLTESLNDSTDVVSGLIDHRNLAKLYQAWGKPDEADVHWRQTTTGALRYIDINFYFMNDTEKRLLWNRLRENFEAYNTFATSTARHTPARLGDMYNNQLATKAILLSASNSIRKRILNSRDTALINAFRHWLDLRNRLGQYYSMTPDELKARRIRLDSLEQVGKAMEKDLNITADDINKDRGAAVTWQDVQRALKPNEAAIELIRFRYSDRHFTDSILYAALVLTAETRTGPLLALFPDGRMMETRAQRYYRNAVMARADDDKSYPSFWAPLAPLVAAKTRLYISLDGVFNEINLATIKDPEGHFLLEKKQVTIVSNTKDILALRSRTSRTSRLTAALLGFPKYFVEQGDKLKETSGREDRSGIAELKGTKEEITAVGRMLNDKAWQVEYFTEESAGEEKLKSLNNPSLLHVATHGFFTATPGQEPMLSSGLLCAGAANFLQNRQRLGEENGILTAYEAANLNLDNTEMVVLSACETARGEVQNGEGVYGLQRAFQTAGAQAILMSLWKVDDEATRELMVDFYRQWTSGKSKSEAFLQAQLNLKNKFSHPYYWGAFVMMGE